MEAKKSKIRVLAGLMSSEDPLPASRWLSSHCISIWWRAKKGRKFVSLLTRALIPLSRVPLIWPNHLPNVPPPNTITLGAKEFNI